MATPKKNILILAANPPDTARLRLDEEVRKIDDGLKRSKHRERFDLKQKWAARSEDMRRAVLDYKPFIVHFCGHGKGEEGIVFEDDTGQAALVKPDALGDFFELFAEHVHCVLFNACYSEPQMEIIVQHIKYVIGIPRILNEKAAVEFAVAFYDALGAGKCVEFAYKLACNALHLKGVPEHITPVLKKLIVRPLEHFLDKNPYCGLEAFQEENADNFFGRDASAEDLQQAVQSQPFIAVIGASGSGKSSLVFAGLVPRLRKTDDWLIANCRPQNYPFGKLAHALIPLQYPSKSKLDLDNDSDCFAAELYEGKSKLSSLAECILKKNPGRRLLLIIDQFEELYTLPSAEARKLQQRFIDRMLEAVQHFSDIDQAKKGRTEFVLLLTIRADFMGHALKHGSLAKALKTYVHGDAILGPITDKKQLRRIIEGPAQKLKVTVEPELAEWILRDIGQQEVSLPLLEFTLTQLWNEQTNRCLTCAAYGKIGGIQKALSNYADKVYELLTPEKQEQLRRIFIQLVRPGEGTEDTRKVVLYAQFDESHQRLLKYLADKRLVVTRQKNDTEQKTVEVVHETLIRHWQRLKDWMNKKNYREFRLWQDNLQAALKNWLKGGKDEEMLRGTQLAEAEEWIKTWSEELSEKERKFIKDSVESRKREIAARIQAQKEREALRQKEAATREQAQKEREAQQRWKIRVLLTSFMIVLVLLALLWWFWKDAKQQTKVAKQQTKVAEQQTKVAEQQTKVAKQQTKVANKERRVAQEQKKEVLRHQSMLWAKLSEQQTERGNAVNGILLALEALPKDIPYPTSNSCLHLVIKWLAQFSITELVTKKSSNLESPPASYSGGIYKQLPIYQPICFQQIKISAFPDILPFSTFWKGLNFLVVNNKVKSDGKCLGEINPVFAFQPPPFEKRKPAASKCLIHYAKVLIKEERRPYVPLAEWALYQALSARREHFILQHERRVIHAAFNHDGTRLATASHDNTARLWNTKSGKLLYTFSGHDREVVHTAFSPDGTRLATASDDNTARLWDTENGDLLHIFSGHTDSVKHAAFSSDGTRLITTSEDKTVRLWDAERRILLHTFSGRKHPIAAFSPDGLRLVTAEDKTAHLWKIESGQLLHIHTLKEHKKAVNHAAFSPDGTRLVTASFDNTAWLWNTENGKLLHQLKGHEGMIYHAAFSLDGARLVTASKDRTARLWNTENGVLLYEFNGHKEAVIHAAFNPDGTHLLTASSDKTARLWETGTGKSLYILNGHELEIIYAAFSPDGTQLVTTSEDHTARLWEIGNGFYPYVEYKNMGWRVALGPDNAHMITMPNDNSAQLWNIENGQLLHTFKGHEGMVYHTAFNNDSTRLVTASGDNTARLWNTKSKELLHTFKGHKGIIYHAAFNHDSTRLVTASEDNTARLWDVKSRKLWHELKEHKGSVYHAAFNPDGTLLVTASEDKTARLWDTESGQSRHTLKEHEGMVYHAAFNNPDGTFLVTSSEDNIARLWNTKNGKCLYKLELDLHINIKSDDTHPCRMLPGNTALQRDTVSRRKNRILATFSPDGTRLATISKDNTIQLWETGNKKRFLYTLDDGDNRNIMYTAFSPDGTRLISASYDNTARLWDTKNEELLHKFTGRHKREVIYAASSLDGTRLVMASSDNTVQLWRVFLTTKEVVDYAAEQQLPRSLTVQQRKDFFLSEDGE